MSKPTQNSYWDTPLLAAFDEWCKTAEYAQLYKGDGGALFSAFARGYLAAGGVAEVEARN